MDDFNVSSLHESKNEWSARLVTILTPVIIDGYKSILEEAVKLCRDNGEMDKYLMTFQNFISRIPKWNAQIIETEKKRIYEKSGCTYLEDLVTCVHIIQLKILTAMRVGQKQKKIDISVPKIDDFIHKTYINVARKLYKNVYLFEINIPPLQTQKNQRELEIIVQEGILNTLRENIPVESILKAYMDETNEEFVTEEVKEEIIEKPIVAAAAPPVHVQDTTTPVSVSIPANENRISFNDIDYVKTPDGTVESVNAPKTIERLEEISEIRAQQQKQMDDDDDDDGIKLNISDQNFVLDPVDISTIEEQPLELIPDLVIDNNIEVLY
jgi:hypothetical protein